MVFNIYTSFIIISLFFSSIIFSSSEKVISIKKNGIIQNIISFSIDKENNFYLSNISSHCIDKYSLKGVLLKEIAKDLLVDPGEIFIYNEKLYVANISGQKIMIFDKEGKELGKVLLKSPYKNGKCRISSLFIDENYLYIGDSYTHSVMKFNLKGEFLFKIGGEHENIFKTPCSIVYKNNIFYISDFETGQIYMFNKHGVLLYSYISNKKNKIIDSLAITDNEYILATDWKNNSIDLYSNKLEFIKSYNNNLLQPSNIILKDKLIFIVDTMNGKIRMLNKQDVLGNYDINISTEKAQLTDIRKNSVFDLKRNKRINKDIDTVIKKFESINVINNNIIKKNNINITKVKKENININKIEQIINISLFRSKTKIYPPYLFILINNSYALKNRLKLLKSSLIEFLKNIDKTTVIRLFLFDKNIVKTKGNDIKTSIENINNIKLSDNTSFWDSLYSFLDLTRNEKNIKSILITSDIIDNNSVFNIDSIKDNFNNKNIADSYIISYKTVKTKTKNILKELKDVIKAKLYFIDPDKKIKIKNVNE